MKKTKIFFKTVVFALCALYLSSCAIIRGYRADGLDGPNIFSFEHCEHDTIAKGDQSFQFPVAMNRPYWLDTLHFYNEAPRCVNMTFEEAIKDASRTQGVMIIHNDSIVYEKYWGDFSADRLATVFSVSKSITSLLCGIAVDEGYIKSIDDPVTKYLPELKRKDPKWERLTIRHLLNMESGLDFDDEYEFNIKELKTVNAIARLNYGHNIMRQIKGLKFRCEPGTEFRYESMTTAILGVVIERATGIHYADYLSEKVWKPLQMESVALINIDSRKHHVAHAFGGITCTLKDLAKIGRLYLNNGVWDGKRIVSEEWIHLTTDFNPKLCYHYSWYDVRYENFRTGQYPGFYALGICNQVLYVNPYKNLIMVRIGLSNNGPAVIPVVFETLSNRWVE
ncbi:MAG: serine hydrolase [Bacteroidales bacterium]|nr:serine hydrolase [Bacteroidales bacterium]